MKTLLNLLPEENRRDIERKTHFRFFLWQLFLIFTLEIFYVSILVSSYIILDFQSKNLTVSGQTSATNQLEQSTLDTYQKKFKETNATVNIIKKINDNHFSFSQIFLLLDDLLPEGIVIDQISTKNYTVSLKGRAETRDNLLAFDAKLKESSCVGNVNVPLSSLFSQENIEFQVDFEIKKECLKNTL